MKIDDLILELKAKTDQLDASLRQIDSRMAGIDRSAKQSSDNISMGFSKGALKAAALAAAVYGAKKGFDAMLQAGREMESLNARMEALTGSASGAREAIAYLSATAQRQSVDLLQLSDGYARLLPAVNTGKVSMAEMRQILELTNDNMAAMRLTGSDVSLMFYGLSQVLGSGTVTMEDIRQVTERIPGSFDRLATAMGKSTGELRDYIATGQVAASEIKGPLIQALSSNAGAAEKMGDTYDAASTRMANATRELASTIADSSGIISGASALFDGIAQAAEWAAEKINILNGNFSRLKLSTLTEQAGEASLSLKELRKELAEASEGTPLTAYGQRSQAQVIRVLNEEIAETETRLKDLQQAMQEALKPPPSTGSGGSGGGTPITPIIKDAEKLEEKLSNIFGKDDGEFVRELDGAVGKVSENMKKLAEEQERNAELMMEPYRNAVRGIQQAFTDTFEGIFDGSIDSASDAADAIKRVFIRMAAELVSLQLFNGVLSGSGLSIGGGRSSSGGASSLLSSGGSILGQITGVTSGISAGINAAAGAALPSLFGTGAPFSAVAAGPAAPGLLTGAGLSASTVLGGVGLAYTALSALGAFSGPRPHPASTFGTRGLDFRNATLLSKHMDTSTASSMAGGLQQALAALSGAGLNLDFIQGLQGGVDDGTGFYSFGDWSQRNPLDTVTFNPEDADQGLADFLKLVLDAAGDLSAVMDAELIPALRELSTEGKTAEEVLNEIVKALTRDDLRKAFMQQVDGALLDQIIPGYAEMAQASAEHAANLARATELGVSQEGIARITALHQANVQRLLQQNDKTYQDSLRKAGELSRRFSQMTDRFGDILWSVRNGSYTPLSPTANLASLRGMVQSAGARAQLGDIAAQEELARLLPQFLELSGSVNGFNEEFEKDRALTESLAEAAQSVAERQAALMENILAQAEEQTDILTRAFGGATASGNANLLFRQAIAAGQIDPATVMNIIRAVGFTGEFGNENATRFLDSNMAANARALQAGAALGLPQFTVPAGTPANDNSAVLSTLTEGFRVLSRVTGASGQVSAESLDEIKAILQRIERDNGLKQWA